MNEHRDPLNRLLSTLDEPTPPRALRERSLTRAGEVWTSNQVADGWCRLWESRPLRLAWALSVLLLAAANVAVRVDSRVHPSRVSAAASELQSIVALPRLRSEYLGPSSRQGQATDWRDSILDNRGRSKEDNS
jgi:hypothetical protein